MLLRFIEWLNFHNEILTKKSDPIYIFLIGCALTLIVLFFYNYNIINISETPIVSELISKNKNFLKHGYLFIALVGFFVSLYKAVDNHQKNIRKIYN